MAEEMVIGILGARNSITKQIIQDEILNPVLNDLMESTKTKNRPMRVLIPSEPLSSTYVECWAERLGIEVHSVKSDWVRHGRRAGILRDAHIEKECNVFIVFEGPKSRYYLELAERIAKRKAGSKVYAVSANSVSPVLLEIEQASHLTVGEKEEAEILTLPKMWSKSATNTQCLIDDDL
jgi:Txe/YoeB family toxin of Txe-Axe toxin-antitoxin module